MFDKLECQDVKSDEELAAAGKKRCGDCGAIISIGECCPG